jgi:lysophospholipase L1-like esterase
VNATSAPARKGILSIVGALVIGFVLAEVLLRALASPLRLDVLETSTPAQRSIPENATSPFSFDSALGYELKPGALVSLRIDERRRGTERMNGEGFRNPDYAVAKPPGTVRLLAVGHSVVQGLEVPRDQSWLSVLERDLNQEARQRYQVLNSAIGGYRARQAATRMERRGLKYRPDLVLLMVGWNDMLFSSLPIWTPDIDLTRIEAAWLRASPEIPTPTWKERVAAGLYRVSYFARLVRSARNAWYNDRSTAQLVAQRQRPGNTPFNEAALRLYVADLERIRRAAADAGARVVLLTEPTILAPDLLTDPDIQRKLINHYYSFPLSTPEMWAWHSRYVEAQRQFAASHPDVVLIDAEAAFAHCDKETRLRYFIDLAHLTPEGNRALASVVLEALRRGALPVPATLADRPTDSSAAGAH